MAAGLWGVFCSSSTGFVFTKSTVVMVVLGVAVRLKCVNTQINRYSHGNRRFQIIKFYLKQD